MTHSSTAVFQEDVYVIFVLKMVVEMDDVFVAECSVQLNLSVYL